MTFCQTSAFNFYIISLGVYKSVEQGHTSIILGWLFCSDAIYLPLFAFTLVLATFFFHLTWTLNRHKWLDLNFMKMKDQIYGRKSSKFWQHECLCREHQYLARPIHQRNMGDLTLIYRSWSTHQIWCYIWLKMSTLRLRLRAGWTFSHTAEYLYPPLTQQDRSSWPM